MYIGSQAVKRKYISRFIKGRPGEDYGLGGRGLWVGAGVALAGELIHLPGKPVGVLTPPVGLPHRSESSFAKRRNYPPVTVSVAGRLDRPERESLSSIKDIE